MQHIMVVNEISLKLNQDGSLAETAGWECSNIWAIKVSCSQRLNRIGSFSCSVNKSSVNKPTNKWFIVTLTCPFGHHQFGFAPGSIPLGGVRSHRDGVSGVWLESSNDHFLWDTGRRQKQGNVKVCLEFLMIWPPLPPCSSICLV